MYRLPSLNQNALLKARNLSSWKNARRGPARYVQPATTTESADIPQFAGLLRQFYKQSHPDLIRPTHAHLAVVNDNSWQTLNGILSTVKEVNTYPPRMTKTMPFYVRSKDVPGGFKQVELTIRTAGGDCKKQLTTTMEEFFIASGISADGKFVWGKEYFPLETVGAKAEEDM